MMALPFLYKNKQYVESQSNCKLGLSSVELVDCLVSEIDSSLVSENLLMFRPARNNKCSIK
jgi:hypothetical protein